MSDLSSADMILVHLMAYWNIRGDLPKAVTQDGISKATRIRRTHVPRILKKMKESGLVDEQFGHVKSVKRRLKTYSLTQKGYRTAEEVYQDLSDMEITVSRESGDTRLKFGEASGSLKMKPLEILNQLTPNKMLIMPDLREEEFLDRINELNDLKKAFFSGSNVIAIYGSLGIGKTSLAKRLLRDLPKTWKTVWYDLSGKTPQEFFSYFSSFLGLKVVIEVPRLADNLCNALNRTNTLIIFDGYFEVPEEIVDFFLYFARRIETVEGFKAIFTVNEATPSYCRFYKMDSVQKGAVREIRLKGLDKETSLDLLRAKQMDRQDFNRIYLMTKGCPLYLKLIREENIEELKEKSRFTLPEIKLMVHYKKKGEVSEEGEDTE
jgi:DNA-binding MarR family transcriptional regulator